MAKKVLPNPDKIVYPDQGFKIIASKKKSVGYVKNFHEELEIKYYYEGRSTVMIENEAHSVKAGDITVVNPYEIHTNVNIGTDDASYYLVMIDLDFLFKSSPLGFDLRQIFFSSGEKLKNIIEDAEELRRLIVRIYDEMSAKSENYKVMVYCLVAELLTLLLRNYKSTERSRSKTGFSGRGAELIAPALAKIFKDYQKPISVDELAGLCGVSKYHFCRVFKEIMGVTALEYINGYRLSVAEIMLRTRDFSIEQVALTCGFNDVSYFYRCYKRIRNKSLRRNDFKKT